MGSRGCGAPEGIWWEWQRPSVRGQHSDHPSEQPHSVWHCLASRLQPTFLLNVRPNGAPGGRPAAAPRDPAWRPICPRAIRPLAARGAPEPVVISPHGCAAFPLYSTSGWVRPLICWLTRPFSKIPSCLMSGSQRSLPLTEQSRKCHGRARTFFFG